MFLEAPRANELTCQNGYNLRPWQCTRLASRNSPYELTTNSNTVLHATQTLSTPDPGQTGPQTLRGVRSKDTAAPGNMWPDIRLWTEVATKRPYTNRLSTQIAGDSETEQRKTRPFLDGPAHKAGVALSSTVSYI
jgi:hypothetical protein